MARQLLSAANNIARQEHMVYNPASLLYEPSFLYEPGMTNLVNSPEDVGAGTWVAGGTPTRTVAAISSAVMGVQLNLIGDDNAAGVEYYEQTIAFTADSAKGISAYLKKGPAASATGCQIVLIESGTSTVRLEATITWDAGGVPTVVMATGSFLGTAISYASGIYRFRFQAVGVLAASTNLLRVYPGRRGAASDVGDVYVGGVQAENTLYATSYKNGTRNAEITLLPLFPVPQEMTIYTKFIELGSILGVSGNSFIWQAGTTATPRILVTQTSGKYRVQMNVAGGAVVSAMTAGPAPAYGDQVELNVRVAPDGAVTIGQSINGGTEVVAPSSAAAIGGLPAAWSSTNLYLGSVNTGAAAGCLAFLRTAAGKPALVAERGTQSLATMRAA